MTLPVAILCGGKATRLGSLTSTLPKSLVQVAGEPFIFHQLRLLHDQGFNDVVLCCGHLGDQIVEAVGHGKRFGMQINYSWDGPKPLGTGGAVKKAIPKLGDTFMVIYGDSYLPIRYQPIVEAFIVSGKLGLMTAYKGVDYGIGIFSRVAFDEFPITRDSFDLGWVYEFLSPSQLVRYQVPERFYEIGSPEGLEEVRNKLSVATNASV